MRDLVSSGATDIVFTWLCSMCTTYNDLGEVCASIVDIIQCSGGVLVYWVIKLFGYCRDEKYAYIVVRRYSFCGNEIYILILKMRYTFLF